MRSLLESDDRDVAIVFLSDKLSNMRSFYRHKLAYGDDLWKFLISATRNNTIGITAR